MTPVRTRLVVVVCLLVSLVAPGCTGAAAGRIAGEIFVGVIGAVAGAAIQGALRSGGGRASYDVPPPMSACEAKLAEWREVHQDEAEAPPAHLQCQPDGDWPDAESRLATVEEAPSETPAARTDVPTPVCGGTATEREECEALRAAREQEERERRATRW